MFRLTRLGVYAVVMVLGAAACGEDEATPGLGCTVASAASCSCNLNAANSTKCGGPSTTYVQQYCCASEDWPQSGKCSCLSVERGCKSLGAGFCQCSHGGDPGAGAQCFPGGDTFRASSPGYCCASTQGLGCYCGAGSMPCEGQTIAVATCTAEDAGPKACGAGEKIVESCTP